MATSTDVKKLLRRIPDAEEALAADMLDDAEAFILAYTGRTDIPETLYHIVVQLAVIYYNRMGMEGETSHSEGVSRTVEMLPEDIRRQLNPYRIARTKAVSAE